MIELHKLGDLYLKKAPAPGRPRHLTAASGLVVRDERVWVVSDEELAVASFQCDALGAGRMHRLDDERLPRDPAERKAAKPDLEALCELPAAPQWPQGALLAIASGATERRRRGWLCLTRADGSVGHSIEVSLHALYETLAAELPDLNVEGAAVAGGRLWLAQRGNGADGANALIGLDLEAALDALATDRTLPAEPATIATYELGEVEGVELAFSDLNPLADGRLAYSAAAEAGASTYHDGQTVGAAIGSLVPGKAIDRPPLRVECPHKVEGVAHAGGGRVLLVADPDDPELPSPLFVAHADLG